MSSARRSKTIVVVQDVRDLPPSDLRVISADEYLAGKGDLGEGMRVVNLCRSWRYLSKGYYVSLLADARGHEVVPTIDTLERIGNPRSIFRTLQEAGVETVELTRVGKRPLPAIIEPMPEEQATAGAEWPANGEASGEASPLVRRRRDGVVTYQPAGDLELEHVLVYAGRCGDARFRRIATLVHGVLSVPVLRLSFLRDDGKWKVVHVQPLMANRLSASEKRDLLTALGKSSGRRQRSIPSCDLASIAVLYDESDEMKASTSETVERLERVGRRMGVYVERIGPQEIHRVADHDGLLIRTLTGLTLPSFRFALRAEALRIPVIDDTRSIIRCCNKVFLFELLSRNGVPIPGTATVTGDSSFEQVKRKLGLPFVLKQPDGSFSNAVFRIDGKKDFEHRSGELLSRSPLLLAQTWTPTDYDWRVGVLGGKPIFVCKYFMARGHWQIRSSSTRGGTAYGRTEAIPIDLAPRDVVRVATKAARLIGDGLYGVDLKMTTQGPVVIEINDNPNLDVGYEDGAEGDRVYEDLVNYFVKRMSVDGRRSEVETREEAPPSELAHLRSAIGRSRRERTTDYRAFEVCGLELEYCVVDRDLNIVRVVEPILQALSGRPASGVDLGAAGLSNEIFDHVLEVKTMVPPARASEAEAVLVEAVRRVGTLVGDRFQARLLPTAMHPWFDPGKAVLWRRSNRKIYDTYDRLFDIRTHGWANVQSCHVNLPLGRDHEAVAMMNASALLVPYLPAVAASSPMAEGELLGVVDGRLSYLLDHQARIPESCGALVPELVDSLTEYRRQIFRPMYAALDRLPDARALRHEFFNARGSVFKFSRNALEVRVLDVQECVRMDVALATFVRRALEALTARIRSGSLDLPRHEELVEDFRATIRDGTAARVEASFLDLSPRDRHGKAMVVTALSSLLEMARKQCASDEEDYLDLVATIIENGNLSERIRKQLLPLSQDFIELTEMARRIYIRLSDCLLANEPWDGEP